MHFPKVILLTLFDLPFSLAIKRAKSGACWAILPRITVVCVIDKTLLTDRRKLSISKSATSKNISATSNAWTYVAVSLLIFQGILYSQFTEVNS